ncbi:hypothetical protein ANANG_G00292820 [Anguilla anguilla]|uniref:G-protein coupled receptors family 3 profile domain-containing protein n=1 Tax=Anguilla anguilla TaxID=7936 RepID=A0A9D3LN60_ANGAN|nr:hypothetical protein ANANG_G00292820 [Anguilla anguilla]
MRSVGSNRGSVYISQVSDGRIPRSPGPLPLPGGRRLLGGGRGGGGALRLRLPGPAAALHHAVRPGGGVGRGGCGAAAVGALAALLLGLVLLGRLRSVTEAEKRSAVGPLLLLLAGVTGLFGLSFAYLLERDERLCVVRRALWGCWAEPGGCALVGAALGLTLVQGMVAAEWLLLTVLRLGQPACQFQPLDFALACSYVLVLLLAALGAAALSLCGKERRWRCSGAWLLLVCLASVLLWAAWLGFYLYGNKALGHASDWDDPALAVALVSQGWVLLLLHAVPEAHLCLRPAPQPSAPDYFDTSQAPSRMRETSFDEDVPLSHRQFVENQSYAFDEHSAGLRAGGNGSSGTGPRPSAPFRSNVYQPTEMTMILNGGAVPSAPPTYTGRQLW